MLVAASTVLVAPGHTTSSAVTVEFPMYTRNYVQEGGAIQLGKSDREPGGSREAEEKAEARP